MKWSGDSPQPLCVDMPATVAVQFMTSDMADRAVVLPGARRPEGKRVEITADDMPTGYRAMRAAIALAKG